MEGGMYVGKHIHLDEQACSVHLIFRATFSPWGLRARLLELRDAPCIRVVRGGRAGTPSSPYFCFWFQKGWYAFYCSISGWKINRRRGFDAVALLALLLGGIMGSAQDILRTRSES